MRYTGRYETDSMGRRMRASAGRRVLAPPSTAYADRPDPYRDVGPDQDESGGVAGAALFAMRRPGVVSTRIQVSGSSADCWRSHT